MIQKYILIDLSPYNMPAIGNALFELVIFYACCQLGYGIESSILTNALKYIEKL